MISVYLAAVFAVAALLTAGAASTAKASPQQAWSGGGGSGTGDQGGATCTNCTICPYSCRVPPQAPPPPPPQLPEFGGYAPPSAGAGPGVGETPSVGGNCPPGTTPMCCPQQQNPNTPNPNNPNPYNPNPNNPNTNFSYYYSPPYSYAPFNGNELRRPFGGVLDGLAGFLQLFFVVILIFD